MVKIQHHSLTTPFQSRGMPLYRFVITIDFSTVFYNSYYDASDISAKNLGEITQIVGRSMEEVLSWFEDEKTRRVNFLGSHCQSTASKLTCRTLMAPITCQNNSPWTRISEKVLIATYVFAITKHTLFTHVSSTVFPSPSRDTGSIQIRRKPIFDGPAFSISSTRKTTEGLCQISLSRPQKIFRRRKMGRARQARASSTNVPSSTFCTSIPSFKLDNFAEHLKGEHDCVNLGISRLKTSCGFKIVDLFHHRYGFYEEVLPSKDESLEHIKEHLKEMS
jgi:hypothetical protein